MYPFELERALAGEPLIYRNREDVAGVLLMDPDPKYYPYQFCIGGLNYTKSGKYFSDAVVHDLDLFMKYPKKQNTMYKPFNLEKALENPSLVLRSPGSDVYAKTIVTLPDAKAYKVAIVWSDGIASLSTEDGNAVGCDIVMKPSRTFIPFDISLISNKDIRFEVEGIELQYLGTIRSKNSGDSILFKGQHRTLGEEFVTSCDSNGRQEIGGEWGYWVGSPNIHIKMFREE